MSAQKHTSPKIDCAPGVVAAGCRNNIQHTPRGPSATTPTARTRIQNLRCRCCYPRLPQNLCLESPRCPSSPRVRRRGVASCWEERCHRPYLFGEFLVQHFPCRYLPVLSSRRFSAALAKSDHRRNQGHARLIVVAISQSKAWVVHILIAVSGVSLCRITLSSGHCLRKLQERQ